MSPHRLPRRRFITTAGGGVLVALAGCSGRSDEPERTPADTPTRTPAPTDSETETGTPTGEPKGTARSENVFYAFAPGKIAVIDPESATVVTELTDGFDGTDWGDAMPSPDNRRLFVNDGSRAQVIVIDTVGQEVEQRVEVGPDPVHMYHPRDGELWTHSDEEGAFYVVDTNDLTVTGRVVAAREDTGHGKLAYHPDLGSKGYATNTNDPGVHVLDMDAKESTDFLEIDGAAGTHAQRVNPTNGFAYFETTGDQAQIVAVDPADDGVVTSFDFTGHIYNTPDGTQLAVTDKGNNEVHVIDAETNELAASIPVEGAPDKIYFHENEGTTYGFTANTQTADTAVIDFDELDVVARIDAGDIARPEGARFLHRGGLTANGYFVTPASGDGIVSIIDANALELHAHVPVAEGVDGVAFVGTIG